MARVDKSAVSICGKYFMFFTNFLVFVISPVLLGFGIYILVYKDKTVSSFIDFFLDPSIWLVIAGSLGTVISFLGLMGSLREILLFLKLYCFLVNFFIFVEIVIIIFIFIFAYSPEVLKSIHIYPEDALKDAVIRYREDLDVEDTIDNIQQQLECCGYSDREDGYKDWNENIYFNCSKANPSFEKCAVPWSCCIFNPGDNVNLLCGAGALDEANAGTLFAAKINKGGCLWTLRTYIQNNIVVVGGIMIGSLFPQFFLGYMAKSLIDGIKIQLKKYKYSEQQAARQQLRDRRM